MTKNVLSIAGFDPSGGAGVLADIKTFAALRCYGLAAITALTAQNTQGVRAIMPEPPEFLAAQIDALFADCVIAAVKIGMLGTLANSDVVVEKLAAYRPVHVVLDPVLAASHGEALAEADLGQAILRRLAPQVSLVTPNLAEAAQLAGAPQPASIAEMEAIAAQLHQAGFKNVLIKGGHLATRESIDVFYDGAGYQHFRAPRIATRNTHGTGCTLSSAIAAELAKGAELPAAIETAKAYVSRSLEAADELSVGRGPGPLQHFNGFSSSPAA